MKIIMRKILMIGLVVVLGMLTAADGMAQGKKGKNDKDKKEVGPPPWAPAHGYRAKTRYVYFKDYDVYYDNERGVYISLSGKNWSVTAKLPSALSGVDLKVAAKIDLDFSGDEPQKDHDQHTVKYPKAKKK